MTIREYTKKSIAEQIAFVEKARLFAIKAHGKQMYGEKPYSFHLGEVHRCLTEYCPAASEHMEAAAWLHDTIEDTEVTFDDIFKEFGRNVARIVFAVTNEEGRNRKERHKRTYPKIMACGRDAIAVKLADRISNTTHSLQNNHGLFRMYQKEHVGFKKALHLPGELKSMWSALDVLMATEIED